LERIAALAAAPAFCWPDPSPWPALPQPTGAVAQLARFLEPELVAHQHGWVALDLL
jgi:hypothetical protein